MAASAHAAAPSAEPEPRKPLRMSFEEFLEWGDEDTWAEWVSGEVFVADVERVTGVCIDAVSCRTPRAARAWHDRGRRRHVASTERATPPLRPLPPEGCIVPRAPNRVKL